MTPPTRPDILADPLLRELPEAEGYRLLDGRFVIFDILGRGGMGTVYRAVHLGLDIEVAIKVLDPVLARTDPAFVERFIREAKAAARIHDRNVISVRDVARAGGLHYIAMEFVEGETARQRVRRKGRLSVEEAAAVTLAAAKGLGAAHREGLVHRDVKPENLLVARDGAVKLADLGLAKMAGDTSLTHTGAAMGTPRYMAPELYDSVRQAGAPADVFALGATFYFLLIGEDAVDANTPAQAMAQVRERDLRRAREARDDVPEVLDELIARATARDPEARPIDGDTLVGELEQALQAAGMAGPVNLADPDATPVWRGVDMVSPPPLATLSKIQLSLDQSPLVTHMALPVTPATGSPQATPRTPATPATPPAAPTPATPSATSGGSARLGRDVSEAAAWLEADASASGDGFGLATDPTGSQLAAGAAQAPDTAVGEPASEASASVAADEGGAASPLRWLLLALVAAALGVAAWQLLGGDDAEVTPVDPEPPVSTPDPDPEPPAEQPEPGPAEEPVSPPPAPLAASLELSAPRLEDGVAYQRPGPLDLSGTLTGGDGTLAVDVDGVVSTLRADGQGRFRSKHLLQEVDEHRVEVRAAGLAEPLVFQVVVDQADPVVTVSEPPPGQVLRTSALAVELSGRVEERHLAELLVGSRLVPVDPDGRWTAADLALEPSGETTFEIVATDRVGRQGRATVTVLRDVSVPQVNLVDPPVGARRVTADRIDLLLEAADDGEVRSLDVQGRAARQRPDGRWEISDVSLSAEGENTLVFEAVDDAGNRGQGSAVLVRDTTGPGLVSVQPTAGAEVAGGEVVEVLVSADEALGSARVDGTVLAVDGGQARGRLTAPSGTGPWSVVLSLTDALGNAAPDQTLTWQVTVPPSLAMVGQLGRVTAEDAWTWARGRPAPAIEGFVYRGENGQGLPTYTLDLAGSGTTMEFVLVPRQAYTMGSPAGEVGRLAQEGPQHAVDVPAFLIASRECTRAQWRAVMGEDPSSGPPGDQRPVTDVSWQDVADGGSSFCGRTGLQLPSEAQWEYATRAGGGGPLPRSSAASLEELAWFAGSNGGVRDPRPVGQKAPNAFGLHDVLGNVSEWCQDSFHKEYVGAPNDGSAWIEPGVWRRVFRGGAVGSSSRYVRSAFRGAYDADAAFADLGFRAARSLPRGSLPLAPPPTTSGSSAGASAGGQTSGVSAGPATAADLNKVKADLKELQSAASIFKLLTQALPSTLDELTRPQTGYPRGVLPPDEMPQDPWGQDYRYQPAPDPYTGELSARVWSIGPDGRDDGGSGGDDILRH